MRPAVLRALILGALLLLAAPAFAATHTVEVGDSGYIPSTLTVTEGDTVHFVWTGDSHNVVSGVPLTPDGAFESELKNRGYEYDVTFDRDLLNAHPMVGNVYNFYCVPHWSMGMVGSITVNRVSKLFSAGLHSWETVGSNSASSATGSCALELSSDETSLSVTCTHNLSQVSSAVLAQGFFGTTGSSFCTLPTASGVQTTCSVNPSQAANLFAGETYINFTSSQYPAGELRGQIVKTGGLNSISGTIFRPDGPGLGGVRITDGSRFGVSNFDGQYIIPNVPNGVYRLTATKGGRGIVPHVSTSPLLVLNGNATNRDFTAYPAGSCGVDTDGDGVCDTDEISDGSDPADPGSYRTRLKSPIYVAWNGFLGATNIIEIFNKSSQAAVVHLTLYDISGVDKQQLDVPLSALGQYDAIVNDFTGFSADSYGIVKIEFDSAFDNLIDGRTFYYRPTAGGSFDFAYAIPFSKPLTGPSSVGFNTFQPSADPAESSNLVANWLSIINLEPDEFRSFTLKKYDQAGSLLSSSTFTIPPLGRTDFDGGHDNPGPSRVGLNTITPSDPTAAYQAVLIRYGGNAPPGQAPARYSFAFPLLARRGSSETQRVPISIGAGAQNWLELVNPSASDVTVAVKAYNNGGQQILDTSVGLGSNQQQHLNIGSLLAAGESGSAEITPAGGGSLIGQSMFYFRNSRGGISSMYGSQIRRSFSTAQYGNYNLFLHMYNWLKLTNVTGADNPVTLKLYRGSQEISSQSILLGPYSGIDLGLHDGSVFGTLPDTYGVIKVESAASGTVASELLRLRAESDGSIDYAAPTAIR